MTTLKGTYTSIKVETDVPVPMRDGVRLYADIYRPDTPGRYPVLLQRTPYDKTAPAARTLVMDAIRAASHGFAVVIQDGRGRHTSEGEFYPFMNEMEDGYDTVEWCAAQPWSTGKVGMYGRSYVGATQWLAAASCPPSLAAISPGQTASDYYEGWTYQGGALASGFLISWGLSRLVLANLPKLTQDKGVPPEKREELIEAVDGMKEAFQYLPLKEFPYLKDGVAPYFYDWLAHPQDDEYWRQWRIQDYHSRIGVPAFNLGGWYDIFLKGTLLNFVGMQEGGASERARSGQRLIIGPWHHGNPESESGQFYFGFMASGAAIDLDGQQLRWFDHWLKGEDNGLEKEAPVRIFVMGENVWRDEWEWPLARTQYVDYYLHSGGKSNTLSGDGILTPEPPNDEPSDLFLYDPRDPVPSRGGGLCCGPSFVPGGAFDQREIEARPDVLVYTTPPLEVDTEVTGPITVTLYAASSASDTDFTAKLVDVCPCGCSRNLADGIIRARYRDSLSTPTFMEPGQVYNFTIDLVATSNLFERGHRIRLEVSSSNFPRFNRNLNTKTEPWEEAIPQPALQRVLHDSQHPSHVTLPIVPRG